MDKWIEAGLALGVYTLKERGEIVRTCDNVSRFEDSFVGSFEDLKCYRISERELFSCTFSSQHMEFPFIPEPLVHWEYRGEYQSWFVYVEGEEEIVDLKINKVVKVTKSGGMSGQYYPNIGVVIRSVPTYWVIHGVYTKRTLVRYC